MFVKVTMGIIFCIKKHIETGIFTGIRQIVFCQHVKRIEKLIRIPGNKVVVLDISQFIYFYTK